MEYPAWRPHFRTDIDLLDGVQRQAIKFISSIKDKTYKARSSYLKSLETRIEARGDLIGVFEIFKGFDNKKFSFAHRIVDILCRQSKIACGSVNDLKNSIDTCFLHSRGFI